MKKTKSEAVHPVLVRLPKKLVAALDKAAKTNCRSRSQEVRVRLERSIGDKS